MALSSQYPSFSCDLSDWTCLYSCICVYGCFLPILILAISPLCLMPSLSSWILILLVSSQCCAFPNFKQYTAQARLSCLLWPAYLPLSRTHQITGRILHSSVGFQPSFSDCPLPSAVRTWQYHSSPICRASEPGCFPPRSSVEVKLRWPKPHRSHLFFHLYAEAQAGTTCHLVLQWLWLYLIFQVGS